MKASARRYLFTASTAALVFLSVSVAAQFGGPGPSVSVNHVLETDAAHAGGVVRIAALVKLAEGWHVNAHEPLDKFLIPTALELEAPEGMAIREIVYPEPETITFEATSEKLAVYGGEFAIGVEAALSESLQPGSYALEGALQYQACDDKQCFPPKSAPVSLEIEVVSPAQALTRQHAEVFASIPFGATEAQPETPRTTDSAPPAPAVADDAWRELVENFDVSGKASGYLNSEDFLAFLDRAESGEGLVAADSLAGRAIWLVILSVLVGGLLLNLTPCVLPLVPINLGIIGAGAKAGSRLRGFLLGGVYGAGIALVYGVLGLAVVLGLSKTFGAINSTPWFNGAIAVVFAALGLAMFDVFLIDFTRYQGRLGIKKGGGSFALAFMMGSVSALLAGACVAPVIISTIVYAQDQYAKGVSAALALPFLLGLGMALPWPFAGAGLSFLPKPGNWMVHLKHAFGVLIFCFALYYGHLAYTLLSDRYPVEEEGWLSSLSQGLDEAGREGKPVLVDFWATWCKNCLTMNKTTFRDPKVLARLEGYVKVKCQAENTGDPLTKEVMEYFGVMGLPTYVTLTPKPATTGG